MLTDSMADSTCDPHFEIDKIPVHRRRANRSCTPNCIARCYSSFDLKVWSIFDKICSTNTPNMFSQRSKPSQTILEYFEPCPSMTSEEPLPRSHHTRQPRSQGPLSTSRKYPGCSWSRPYVYKSNPNRVCIFD